jgi:hypothetical protein
MPTFSFGDQYEVQEPSLDGIQLVLAAIDQHSEIKELIAGFMSAEDAEAHQVSDAFHKQALEAMFSVPGLAKATLQAFVYDADGNALPADVAGRAKPSDIAVVVEAVRTDPAVLGGLLGLVGKVRSLATQATARQPHEQEPA